MSLLFSGDVYKYSSFKLLSKDINKAQFYFGPRDNDSYIVGQNILASNLNSFTQEELDLAHAKLNFDKTPWQYLLDQYPDKLPLKVTSVKEGSYVRAGSPAVVIEIIDPKCIWLGQYLEALVYHALWYTSTVSTKIMKIKEFLESQGIYFFIPQYNRGSKSLEQSAKASLCYNLIYSNTNPTAFNLTCYDHPKADVKDYRIVEHMTILLNGEDYTLKDTETNGGFIMNDTSDISTFYSKNTKPVDIMVDSGDPLTEMLRAAKHLEQFGFELIDGKKKLKKLILQLDNILFEDWKTLILNLKNSEYHISNFIFGDDNYTAHEVTRDTLGYAYKCSAVDRGTGYLPLKKQTANKVTFGGVCELEHLLYYFGERNYFKYEDIRYTLTGNCV